MQVPFFLFVLDAKMLDTVELSVFMNKTCGGRVVVVVFFVVVVVLFVVVVVLLAVVVVLPI
jgi:hypothetical protein